MFVAVLVGLAKCLRCQLMFNESERVGQMQLSLLNESCEEDKQFVAAGQACGRPSRSITSIHVAVGLLRHYWS